MPKETQPDPWKQDSNWLLCYVVIILIPVIFVCIAAVSVWRDRRASRRYDIEAINSTYAKYWSGFKDHTPPPKTRPTQYSQATQVPMHHVNRVGPRTAGGFPAPAPSPPRYPQRPMVERVSASTVTTGPPVWAGGASTSAPSNYSLHSMYSQKSEGNGPWVTVTTNEI